MLTSVALKNQHKFSQTKLFQNYNQQDLHSQNLCLSELDKIKLQNILVSEKRTQSKSL